MTDIAPYTPEQLASATAASRSTQASADLLAPITPAEQAKAKIIELKSDPAWLKRYHSNDRSAFDELHALHEKSFQPAPGSVISGQPTVEAQNEQTAADIATLTDLPDDVVAHVCGGAPVSETEYKQAAAKKSALFRDPEWRGKYLAGDHEAGRQLLLLNIIMTSPIKLEASR
ncbi:hypothetical protein [Bradyrhizobium sp.]|uniref:hypothetical protein n=1 Tax=Bradyrhizobium sp. TaxID=376 RepID=UPI002D473B9C|nr:hypothetical protein [Bradyrhizobium sp.]HZR74550.1 hypothetical protein [Bradyrhizobium sp.]